MLDRIGDVQLVARPAECLEGAIEQLACRPDEGSTLPILLVTRLLADEHQSRADRSFAPHGLRRVKSERTLATAGRGLSKHLQRFVLAHWSCVIGAPRFDDMPSARFRLRAAKRKSPPKRALRRVGRDLTWPRSRSVLQPTVLLSGPTQSVQRPMPTPSSPPVARASSRRPMPPGLATAARSATRRC